MSSGSLCIIPFKNHRATGLCHSGTAKYWLALEVPVRYPQTQLYEPGD